MPLELPKIRPARLAAALAALSLTALAGCQTSRELIGPFTHPAPPVLKKPAPPKPLTTDLILLRRWLDAPPADQRSLLAAAEEAYRADPGDRQTLRLALLLGEPSGDTPAADLPRAQTLLQRLLSDPESTLSPGEQTLARFELVLITRQLTLQTENRTLQLTGAQRLADLRRRLLSTEAVNVALQRQLGVARAKLIAIANIEKSLEGKLGTEAAPK